MDEQKIFVGSGKDFHFQNGGQSLGLTICLNDLWEASKEYGFEYNGKKYIKLKAVSKREPDQHGKTHYVEVDTYRPDSQSGNNGYQQYTPPAGPASGGYEDDIPF